MPTQYKIVLFLGFFYCLLSPQLYSQTFVIKEDKKSYRVKSNYAYYEDNSENLSIQEVTKVRFISAEKEKPVFRPFQDYWLKLNITSELAHDTDWILSIGDLSYVDVYIPRFAQGKITEEEFELKKTGQFLPVSQRDIQKGKRNTVEISLPAQNTLTVYIKFRHELEQTPYLGLKLTTETIWQSRLIDWNLTQGVFQGLLWMVLLYNLFLFFSVKDRAYGYYTLFIFFTSVYFLNFYEYLEEYVSWIGNLPIFNMVYLPFSIYLGFVFYFQFMRYFLQTPKKLSEWDGFVQVIVWIFTFLTIGMAVLAHFNYELYLVTEKYFLLLTFSIVFFFLLIFLIKVRSTIVTYFVIGTICMLTGGILLMLKVLLNVGGANIYYFQIGIALEVFVFSLGLSHRYKISESEKRKAQENLIQQMQENEKLQTKVNRELEEKVRERTAEIEKNKEEILAQSEEIATQRDDLELKKVQIEEQHGEIKDSIQYASRIQRAILGNPDELKKRVKDSFIYYQPKDIVSGDFYWFTEKQLNDRKFQIIVAADCTGHGVPGAFMTVMGNDLLNHIVIENNIIKPDLILNELDKGVIQNLQTIASNNPSKTQLQDGMDITIMVYDEKNKKLAVSAAKNSLYYIRDFELQEIKADKHSIGYSMFKDPDFKYSMHLIDVIEDDVFFMYSDGFQDQFGGKKGKKFMKGKFKKILLKNSHLDMNLQQEKLQTAIQKWMRNAHKQVDDILVTGVKFF